MLGRAPILSSGVRRLAAFGLALGLALRALRLPSTFALGAGRAFALTFSFRPLSVVAFLSTAFGNR